jgi:predicted RNA-binding protein YlxR (DUF448 family)
MGRSKRGHRPIRTCISCGKRLEKRELIRVVLDEEGCLVEDEKALMHGRGAYVCRVQSCRDALTQGRRLERAFRGRRVRI